MVFIVSAMDKAMVIAMTNIAFRNPMALPGSKFEGVLALREKGDDRREECVIVILLCVLFSWEDGW